MKRAGRQRLWLLLCVAGLAALATWQMRREAQRSSPPLLTLDPDAIDRVTLSLPGAPGEHYQRRQGHWWRVDGIAVAADDDRLADMTRIAAAPVAVWRPLSDFEPIRIGVQPPIATLTLNGQALAFGDTSATAPLRYVRVGERVALVPLRYMPRPASPPP